MNADTQSQRRNAWEDVYLIAARLAAEGIDTTVQWNSYGSRSWPVLSVYRRHGTRVEVELVAVPHYREGVAPAPWHWDLQKGQQPLSATTLAADQSPREVARSVRALFREVVSAAAV